MRSSISARAHFICAPGRISPAIERTETRATSARSAVTCSRNSSIFPADLLDVDLAYAFIAPNDFHLVADLVRQPDTSGHGVDDDERRGSIGGVQLHVFDSDQSIKERLPGLEI